ncbi:MAG: peptidoglycan-binding protein [Geminicoccaceae bacterium]|nr:peptidoglycan-binding protein [Geminicoccaceae bacterium]MDW8369395.1 peptidoglycan-binding protein [Geminicoccaceae bacterium]
MRPILRRGARGHEVEQLQRLLARAGFAPGPIDGRFGAATEAALVAFQRAHGLLADGVCGPVSWGALFDGRPGRPLRALDRVDVEFTAQLFPFTALDSIARHLPHVAAGLEAMGLVDKPMVLVALATIRAESEGFEPIDETVSRFNTSPGGRPFDLYDHRRDLGNEGPPDGARFKGRGFVQLTGRANYAHTSRALGLGDLLLREPERANEPTTAGLVLALFLAERQLAIKEALLEGDLRRARRLVNGGLHGFERFRDAYRRGERLLADPIWPVRPERAFAS